jgi:hypothetical protein
VFDYHDKEVSGRSLTKIQKDQEAHHETIMDSWFFRKTGEPERNFQGRLFGKISAYSAYITGLIISVVGSGIGLAYVKVTGHAIGLYLAIPALISGLYLMTVSDQVVISPKKFLRKLSRQIDNPQRNNLRKTMRFHIEQPERSVDLWNVVVSFRQGLIRYHYTLKSNKALIDCSEVKNQFLTDLNQFLFNELESENRKVIEKKMPSQTLLSRWANDQ